MKKRKRDVYVASKLVTDGVVVLPLQSSVANPAAIRTYLAEAPELLHGSIRLSGNAKIPFASSHHHPIIRQLRKDAHKTARDAVEAAYEAFKGVASSKVVSCIDALVIRRENNKSLTPEKQWHRDCVKDSSADVLYFGGWINLGDTDQFFQCVKGSHLDENGHLRRVAAKGFVKADKAPEESQHVKVPPGHILIFAEWMLHTILPDKCLRLFTGFGATHKAALLPERASELSECLRTQSIVWIKGGSFMPLMHTGKFTYMNSARNKGAVLKWAQEFLVEDLVELVRKWCKDGGNPPVAPSLVSMNAPYIPYSEDDLMILGL